MYFFLCHFGTFFENVHMPLDNYTPFHVILYKTVCEKRNDQNIYKIYRTHFTALYAKAYPGKEPEKHYGK